MSLKRKLSDDVSPEDEVSLLEDQELGLLQNGVAPNDRRILQIRERQMELYRQIYPPGMTPRDTILYQLRLHAVNFTESPSVRMNYLTQIVNHRKPKQSTFTFTSSSETNNNTNTTRPLTDEQIREQIRLLRLSRLNKNSFGKKLLHYYTKHKNKTRREALIKLRKFFSKYI